MEITTTSLYQPRLLTKRKRRRTKSAAAGNTFVRWLVTTRCVATRSQIKVKRTKLVRRLNNKTSVPNLTIIRISR